MQNKDPETTVLLIRYESLYRHYRKALRRRAYQFLGDEYLAEDAMQQTFLRLLKYKERLAELRPGGEWMYLKTMLRNVCYSILKSRRFVCVCDIQSRVPVQLHVIGAENEYMSGLQGMLLEDLPEMYGKPLKLHYLERYSYEEIGEMQAMSPATVRKHAERGKRMLAGYMKTTA